KSAGEAEALAAIERPVAPEVARCDVDRIRAVVNDVRIADRTRSGGRRRTLQQLLSSLCGTPDRWIRPPMVAIVVAPRDPCAAEIRQRGGEPDPRRMGVDAHPRRHQTARGRASG